MLKRYRFILLLLAFPCFSQRVAPIDVETLEFIPDVNYHLLLGKRLVASRACENGKATKIDNTVSYDSIVFEKMGFESFGMRKDTVSQPIFLKKKTEALDEMVLIRSSRKDSILGEKNKFLRKANRPMIDQLAFGIWVENPFRKKVKVKSFQFFVDKVKYKTAYRICFYQFNQVEAALDIYEFDKVLFSSTFQYLDAGYKGPVTIDLSNTGFQLPLEGILASVELVGYTNAEEIAVIPENDDRAKIKFQFSNKVNYFSKTVDFNTHIVSKSLMNVNAQINYDFAFQFYRKPHKSNLAAPAYFLMVRP
jgi:hypothetical protein